MAEESSSTSYNAASPSPDSYIGCFISVTSKSDIRYEGFIYYLNPQDSTLGLRDVRSYGTEGRTRNGQPIPPSDRVYEYIMFRGCDIKDLQVKASPSLQAKDPVYNDPAIIQFNNYVDPSRSSKSVPVTGSSSSIFNLCSEPSAIEAQFFPSTSPLGHSGTKLGAWDFSLSEQTTASSYDMPVGKPQRQGCSRSPGSNNTGVNWQYSPSTTELYSMQNSAPTMMAMTNLQPSSPINHSTLINSSGLVMPFSLKHQVISHPVDQVLNKAVADPTALLPVRPFPYSTSVDSISEPSVRQHQTLSTPEAQPKLYENAPAKIPYADQKDMSVTSSTVLNLLSPAPLVVQLNHSSLPPSQKLQCPSLFSDEFNMEVVNEKKLKNDEVWGHVGKPDLCEKVEGIQESGTSSHVTRDDNSDSVSNGEPKLLQTSQFIEEFDFQAMNQKFNKDEIWEYLAKVNIRDRPDGIHKIGTSSNGTWTDTPDLVSNKDRKPAYNKDDFFHTISVNSEGHVSRNGHIQSSEG